MFLDFDGTLAEIAEHPDEVHIPAHLPGTLAALEKCLGGSVALVSGRSIAVLDQYLGLAEMPAAGLHGLECRRSPGKVERHTLSASTLNPLRAAASRYVEAHPGLLLEDKGLTIALHYRAAKDLAEAVGGFMAQWAARLPEFQLVTGKMVVELKPYIANKGSAVQTFMREPTFRGTTPIFAGDDDTDEDGFAAVQALGGTGIKVGEGDTCALTRVPSVSALLVWLEELKCRLSNSA